ncbi:hypothetical protein Tco_0534468 [Tanacetum coccineum]
MSTYLKNMAGYKHSQLKRKSYDEIQKLFDKEMKRVNTFMDMNSEVVKGSETRTEESSKRAGGELESDMSKKQKVDEHVEAKKDNDQEEEEMKRHIELVKNDEVAIDAIPIATKPQMLSPRLIKYEKIGDPFGRWLKLNIGIQGLMLSEMRSKTYQRRDKGKDYHEYGLPILETMLTEAIKQSESYQMFIKYSTGQIRPKKSRGKGSQGKKTADDSQETVDVYEESEPEPEPVKKKTSSKRRVKKKVTLSADDNIISDDPDAALELAKSISKTKAEEAEEARQVHATHARIVTESVPESAKKKSGGRSSKSVVIQDTPSAPKSKPATSKAKLKGASSLTPVEQEAVNIMQALKESKKISRRQPGTGGSNEGTGTKPGVPDESTVVSATSSEGTGIKPGVPDEEKDITEEKVILEWGDEQDSEHSDDDNDDVEKDDKDGDADDEGDDHISDTQDADDEDVKTESDEDDIYKYKIRVRKDEDEEMINAEVDDSDKGDEEITDAAKADAEKTSEVKDDPKKTELPPSICSLSVSSVPTPVQESPLIATVTTLPPPSVSTTPPVLQQTTIPIPIQPITIDAPTVTIAVPESNALTVVELKVAKLEIDMSDLKTVDHSTEALLFSRSKKSEKEQAEKQQKLKFTIKSTNKAAFEEYDLKSALYQSMHANKSINRNPANHRLYHALMEALTEDENVMDKGVVDIVKDHKRKHDNDEDDDDKDPLAGPNQGKKTKRRKTKGSESSKKPSSTEETPKGKAPTKGSKTNDVAHDDNQSQDTLKPKTRKNLNPDWFKQPPRPPTIDPEWNKHQVVLDQPEQPWFNQMVSVTKDPLTLNDLMATPIDFSKYVLNGLKIKNLTQDILLGHAFNLLKGTCSSSIELEYNFQECFNALTDKLDWNNPEGYCYQFDLSMPLPLQGPPGHRTVVVDYFFNNVLEYLKTSNPEVTYTSSITKTKAARYEIKRIEDMAILGVKSVSVKNLHGYGHLQEIGIFIAVIVGGGMSCSAILQLSSSYSKFPHKL